MEKKIKHYQSGDKVEYRGEVTTVAFTYLTKGRLNGQIFQFVHLQNGERNVPASKINFTNKKLSIIFKSNDKLIQHNNVQTKSQIKEDQMDPKSISNKELAALSKEEINNAMGAPYAPAKLKKITQIQLIEEYKKFAKPKKEKEKTEKKASWKSEAKKFLLEKPRTIEETIEHITKNHGNLITKAFREKNEESGEFNVKKLTYYITCFLNQEKGVDFGKGIETKKTGNQKDGYKFQLVPLK